MTSDQNQQLFYEECSIFAYNNFWFCDDTAIFSRDTTGFVLRGIIKMRRVKKQKLCMLFSRCCYGVHNYPSTNKFPHEKEILNFSSGRLQGANFVLTLFFSLGNVLIFMFFWNASKCMDFGPVLIGDIIFVLL